MLVEWCVKNLHHLAYRGEGAGPNDTTQIDLIFGVNAVPDAIWNDAKKFNKDVANLVKTKKIKERGSEDLSKRDEEDAVELVKNTFEEKLLKAFARDPRSAVSDQAKANLEEIKEALHGGRKSREE